MPSCDGNGAGGGFDVNSWIEALGRGDVDALRAAATDDMVVETVGSWSPLAGRRSFDEFSENLAVLADLTKNGIECRITELIAEDDRIALEFLGRAELADGTVFDEIHFVVLYLRDGKVCRIKKYAESELVEAVFGSLVRRRS
jgi:ketosteroid isomerase-like protein